MSRLRRWLDRPLADGDRPRLFLGAVAVLVVGGLVLAATRPDPELGRRTQVAPRATSAPITSLATESVTPTATARAMPPSEEGRAAEASSFNPVMGRRVRRSARRFLAGYLPFTYGRGQVAAIRSASPAVRDRLARERPRVPGRERRRQVRIELVQVTSGSRNAATASAMVNDGARRYSVSLQLAPSAGVWRVVAVGA